MKRSKKIFLAAAVVFLAFWIGVIYDMSTKTTFPGSKKRKDSVARDSMKSSLPPKTTTQQP
ncbi:MAG: hypothetical protein SH819_09230 [Cytophagales bacterium]|nr:hypothetical protein [Cytophagales bacterium]